MTEILEWEKYCLKCDVRTEMKRKVSWTVFAWIIGGLLAIGAVFAGIFVPIVSTGAKSMIETSQKTLTVVHRIEINQAILGQKLEGHLAGNEDYDDH
jgi:hypothetical protein